MYPLVLSASPENWYFHSKRKADAAFRSFQEKVFTRDNYTCQYCGFQAKEYQEVTNLDGNYQNNKLSNLVTACCFCAQCCFIDAVGVGDYGGGALIYCPEMTQNQINSLCHVLFCAISNDTGYKSSAQALYRSYKFRSQAVEDKFGEGVSDPAVLGQLLVDFNVSEQLSQRILNDVRLLPSRAKFSKQIETWAKAALDELSA